MSEDHCMARSPSHGRMRAGHGEEHGALQRTAARDLTASAAVLAGSRSARASSAATSAHLTDATAIPEPSPPANVGVFAVVGTSLAGYYLISWRRLTDAGRQARTVPTSAHDGAPCQAVACGAAMIISRNA